MQESHESRATICRKAGRAALSHIDAEAIFSKEDVETHFHIYEPGYAKMQTYAAPVIYGALTIMHER